ncbi:MAG TPA: alpha/beta hydrolase [Candidatus Acidoferrales bacterium]|nr:alpha/beta hydrolase [Candidatus Acidoferrales bacterium]
MTSSPENQRAYEIAGPVGAPAIVFLHGIRVTRRMWQLQIERLKGEFRVIALDLPGHGSQRGIDFSLKAAIDCIASVIDREARGRALVVGLSLGGYVAMEFGARYPSKAAGLVIASASVEPSGWYNFPYRGMAWALEKMPENWTSWMSCKFFEFVYGDERARLLTDPGFYARGGVQAFHELFEKRFRPAVAAYTGPVLFLNGARDLGFRLQERKFLAAAPNGRLQTIPRAFHIANLDQPETFTEAVRSFAKSIAW